MSLLSIIPHLMSVSKLIQACQKSLFAFLKDLPDSFSEGVRFLLTGLPNPWLVHKNRTVPLNPISVSTLEQYWPVGEVVSTQNECCSQLELPVKYALWVNQCWWVEWFLNPFFSSKMSKLVQFRIHVHPSMIHTVDGNRFPLLVCNSLKYMMFVWCACNSVYIWLLRLLGQHSHVDSIFW